MESALGKLYKIFKEDDLGGKQSPRVLQDETRGGKINTCSEQDEGGSKPRHHSSNEGNAATTIVIEPTAQNNKDVSRRYRPEIQGVRAIGALAVMLGHIWPDTASIGSLAVFYFLIGLFFLDSLSKKCTDRRHTSFHVWETLSSNLGRLLPEAYLIILLTCAWILTYSSPLTQEGDMKDGFYASMFASNWWFLSQGTDYFARSVMMSPFLPFWSLSLIVQVYVVATLAYGVLHKVAAFCSPAVCDTLNISVHAVITISSGSYMWYALATGQFESVHFHPYVWVWAFSLGALVARATRTPRVSPGLSRLLTILSFLAIFALVCSDVMGLDVPSELQLCLLFTAVFVVVAGSSPAPTRLLRVYSWPLLVHLGDISYFIFLLHWPIIVAYRFHTGAYDLSAYEACGILLVVVISAEVFLALMGFLRSLVSSSSAVLATGEKPAHAPQPSKSSNNDGKHLPAWVLVMVPLIVHAMLSTVVETVPEVTEETTEPLSAPLWMGSGRYPGALTRMGQAFDTSAGGGDDFFPSIELASRDYPQKKKDSVCLSSPDGKVPMLVCPFGVPEGKKVAMFGASHMGQWQPALEQLAMQYEWDAWYMSKPRCDYYDYIPTPECTAWLKAASAYLVKHPVEYIFVQATAMKPAGGGEATFAPSQQDFFRKLKSVGTTIIALRDTPRLRTRVPLCMAIHGNNAKACKISADIYHNDTFTAVSENPMITTIDVKDMFCGPTYCEPVIGNVLVYRDADHITATYMKTLTPILEMRLLERVPDLLLGKAANTTGDAVVTGGRPTGFRASPKPWPKEYAAAQLKAKKLQAKHGK